MSKNINEIRILHFGKKFSVLAVGTIRKILYSLTLKFSEKAMKKVIDILVIAFVVLASFYPTDAQQEKKIPQIGFLGQGKPFLYRARIKALHQGLGKFGYVARS